MQIIGEIKDPKAFQSLYINFSENDATRVKNIEKVTNHDVKAVEYFIKEKLIGILNDDQLEFIHFGLTSQDINNTAMPLMIQGAVNEILIPHLSEVIGQINNMSHQYKSTPMLARTHGQPASPTTVGKEMNVFVQRLEKQLNLLIAIQYEAKFGGATGNFNAHKISYSQTNWPIEMDAFIKSLGLERQKVTTQIEHYDGLAELFHVLSRINTILIDFSRDIWTYISINYFKQKVIANEVGSSAMPHKVNPIDFENAEGNLSLANAIFSYLSDKLPISRLQRDLTDSTVSRNVGVPFGHTLIAYKSLLKGMGKLEINEPAIYHDLEANWAVVSEGIQTILRREGFKKPYELLKTFSRGKGQLSKVDFQQFIDQLEVSDEIKAELHSITPYNYIGYAAD
jgi:adenylosuccinate lyase